MESFEHKMLKEATLKPSHFYRYVDDTFVVCPHGLKALNDYLQFLNGIHKNI